MHEHSFIDAILRSIKNPDEIIAIELEVGELAGIESNHLKTHLKERFDYWDIEIEEKQSKIKCFCGYEGPAQIRERLHDFVVFDCPMCERIPEVLEGQDIKILKITYK